MCCELEEFMNDNFLVENEYQWIMFSVYWIMPYRQSELLQFFEIIYCWSFFGSFFGASA
jgi:hypothetical protein